MVSGWIEPYNTMMSTSRICWAILSLSEGRCFAHVYIKPLHIFSIYRSWHISVLASSPVVSNLARRLLTEVHKFDSGMGHTFFWKSCTSYLANALMDIYTNFHSHFFGWSVKLSAIHSRGFKPHYKNHSWCVCEKELHLKQIMNYTTRSWAINCFRPVHKFLWCGR